MKNVFNVRIFKRSHCHRQRLLSSTLTWKYFISTYMSFQSRRYWLNYLRLSSSERKILLIIHLMIEKWFDSRFLESDIFLWKHYSRNLWLKFIDFVVNAAGWIYMRIYFKVFHMKSKSLISISKTFPRHFSFYNEQQPDRDSQTFSQLINLSFQLIKKTDFETKSGKISQRSMHSWVVGEARETQSRLMSTSTHSSIQHPS